MYRNVSATPAAEWNTAFRSSRRSRIFGPRTLLASLVMAATNSWASLRVSTISVKNTKLGSITQSLSGLPTFQRDYLAFSINTVTQTAPSTIRVKFDTTGFMPLTASKNGIGDATNPTYWTLVGSGNPVIAEARTVSGDPYSIDLIANLSLIANVNYILNVGALKTSSGVVLTGTITFQFQTQGANKFFSTTTQQTAEDVLEQNLNPIFTGKGWEGWVAGLGYSDQKLQELSQAAFYQGFLTTASGLYLDRLAASENLDRPPNTGMDDDTFRKLSIGLKADKVNTKSFESVLEAYYGIDGTRTQATSQIPQTWAIADDDDIVLDIDYKHLTLKVQANDFRSPGLATAVELAASLNKQLSANNVEAFASAYVDPSSGLSYLRFYAGIPGIKGIIKIYGGALQNTLKFPGEVATFQDVGTQWDVAVITPERLRFSYVLGTDPQLGLLSVGDYASIYGPTFEVINRGTFEITAVTDDYFEVNNLGVAEAATQTSANDIVFMRPQATTIHALGNFAAVIESGTPSRVLLPAVSQSVARIESTGWYLNGEAPIALDASGTNARDIDGILMLTTATPHGLVADDFTFLQDMRVSNLPAPAPTVAIAACPLTTADIVAYCRLLNGKTLVTAKVSDQYSLYDPETDTWSTPASTPASGAAAHSLAASTTVNRAVYRTATTIEIYDADGDVWSTVYTYALGYSDVCQLVAMKDGNVFSIGRDAGSNAIALVINPATGVVTDIQHNLLSSDIGDNPGAVETADNQLIVIGGTGKDTLFVYNPINETWRLFGAVLTDVRQAMSAIFVPVGPRGQIWSIAGRDGFGTVVNIIDRFDLATETRYVNVSSSYNLPTADPLPSAYLLSDGRVMVIPSTAAWNVAAIYDASDRPNVSRQTFVIATGTVDNVGHSFVDNTCLIPTRAIKVVQAFNPQGSGRLSGMFKVLNAPTPTTLTFETETEWPATITGGFVVPVAAELGTIASSYILDTTSGVGITGTYSALSADLDQGYLPPVISVLNASDFPDTPGYIVFGFGTKTQSRPIQYLGLASSTQLRMDTSEYTDVDYDVGTDVTLLLSRGVYNPNNTASLGVTWLTASAVGRIEAASDIDEIKGSGLYIIEEVIYPSDTGLGNAGQPKSGVDKISDAVLVWGGDDVEDELEEARND